MGFKKAKRRSEIIPEFGYGEELEATQGISIISALQIPNDE